MRFDNGIQLEDVHGGLLVRQHADAYVARRWRLTQPTIELVKTALCSDLRWMIREGHPQPHARWPNGKGRVYLAFSPTRENHWSVAIDSFSESRGDFASARPRPPASTVAAPSHPATWRRPIATFAA